MLPGLVRFAGAFLRERPDRVSGSSKESSSWSWVCFEFCGVSTSMTESCSASFPLPFARDLRWAFAFGGVCFGRIKGGTSSRGNTSGRGLAGVPGAPVKLDRFQRLLADTGVARALCGERVFVGVEKDCLAWMTRGCICGAPGLPVPGVCMLALDDCRLLAGVDI
jgi:hypothetical protein